MYPEALAQVAGIGEQMLRVWDAFGLIFHYAPYWGPPILAVSFWHVWMRYVRARFIADQEYILLELRLPSEVYKSPQAMLAVFDGLFMFGGEATFLDRIWLGKVRMWYSFEIVSIEGQVHLYIWARSSFRRFIERTIYAHYPEAEVVEVEDYALAFPFSLDTHNVYGMDYMLMSPIGVPIRTYTEFNLDQSAMKEEQKVDPMAHVLEFAGSMGKGEHLWIQILARAHKKEDITFGMTRNAKSYNDIAKEEVSKIRNTPEETIVFPDGGVGKTLSDRQIKRIQAINRTSLASSAWDVGIRAIYLAEHEQFDGVNVSGIGSMWQPFGTPGYNMIIPSAERWQNKLAYPWQDFNGVRENRMKVQIVDAYRRRSWFHAPYVFRHFMLTSEELATLYHLPGSVAKTPTIQRITSTRAQAPANLPTH